MNKIPLVDDVLVCICHVLDETNRYSVRISLTLVYIISLCEFL